FTSTFLIAILGTFVTEKIVEPKLGQYSKSEASINLTEQKIEPLTTLEKKGLIGAGISFAILGILLALTIVPEWGVLRHPETGEVSGSPFLKGIVTFIFITFAIPGYVYGRITKVMKTDRDVIGAMSDSMSSRGRYIVWGYFPAP